MAGAIPYSRAPKLTPEMERQLDLAQMVYEKELTLEQALEQGYKPDNEPWGLSQVPIRESKPQSNPNESAETDSSES